MMLITLDDNNVVGRIVIGRIPCRRPNKIFGKVVGNGTRLNGDEYNGCDIRVGSHDLVELACIFEIPVINLWPNRSNATYLKKKKRNYYILVE